MGHLAIGVHRHRHVRDVARRKTIASRPCSARLAVRSSVAVSRSGVDVVVDRARVSARGGDLRWISRPRGDGVGDRSMASDRPTSGAHSGRSTASGLPIRRSAAGDVADRASSRPPRRRRAPWRCDLVDLGGFPDRICPCRSVACSSTNGSQSRPTWSWPMARRDRISGCNLVHRHWFGDCPHWHGDSEAGNTSGRHRARRRTSGHPSDQHESGVRLSNAISEQPGRSSPARPSWWSGRRTSSTLPHWRAARN